jgi:hypothetical protein
MLVTASHPPSMKSWGAGDDPMWKVLQISCRARDGNANQRNRDEPGLSPISAVDLASLLVRAPDSLMIFDHRESAGIEAYPCTIRGALLTFNVNFDAPVPWIPPETIVVLHGTADIPARYAFFHLLSRKLRFCALFRGDCAVHSRQGPRELNGGTKISAEGSRK